MPQEGMVLLLFRLQNVNKIGKCVLHFFTLPIPWEELFHNENDHTTELGWRLTALTVLPEVDSPQAHGSS